MALYQFWEFNTLLFITTKRKDIKIYRLFLQWMRNTVCTKGIKRSLGFLSGGPKKQKSWQQLWKLAESLQLQCKNFSERSYIFDIGFLFNWHICIKIILPNAGEVVKKGVIFFICGGHMIKLQLLSEIFLEREVSLNLNVVQS